MQENPYWGSDEGIRVQKEFEAMIPKPWKRFLITYRTADGEQFQKHLGDNYEFRKYENEIETQAIKLYWDWHSSRPRWQLLVGKRYETKDGKIKKVVEYDTYEFKELPEARDKVLELMRK